MRIAAIVVFSSLFACNPGRGDQPPSEVVVDVPSAAFDGSQAGWDGLPVDWPIVRDYVWGSRRSDTPDSWIKVDREIWWADAAPTLIAADGTSFPLVEVEGPDGKPMLVSDGVMLPPGRYTLQLLVEGFEPQRYEGVVIGEHGQVDDFDTGVLDGRIYSPVLRTSSMTLADRVQIHLRVRALDGETAQLSVWAEGSAQDQASLCRAWQGPVRVGPTGIVSVDEDELTAGGATPITFTDVSLRLGVDAAAAEVGGLELRATMDTRPLDPLVDDDPAPLGATCAVMESLGTECFACDSDGEPFCADVAVLRGFGSSRSEQAFLSDLELDLASVDEAPVCGGPDDGGDLMICSALGPVGIGGWFVGLGVLLVRRRRQDRTHPRHVHAADPGCAER